MRGGLPAARCGAVIAHRPLRPVQLATTRWIPVTATLPGIAGFIFECGMAVDANVMLIFERVKEELRRGPQHLDSGSIDTGFFPGLQSILDGHLTTLDQLRGPVRLGTGLVKGFAVTLAIGVLAQPVHRPHGDPLPVAAADGTLPLAQRPPNFVTAGQLPA